MANAKDKFTSSDVGENEEQWKLIMGSAAALGKCSSAT